MNESKHSKNSLRLYSRLDFEAAHGLEHLNACSLQRIADAVEVMAKRYTDLIDDRNRYLRWYEEQCKINHKLELGNRALRGQITKPRKKLAGIEAEREANK